MSDIYVTDDPHEDIGGVKGPVLQYSGDYYSDYLGRDRKGQWRLIYDDDNGSTEVFNTGIRGDDPMTTADAIKAAEAHLREYKRVF